MSPVKPRFLTIIIIVCCCAMVWWCSKSSLINEENYNKIQKDMTIEQAEALLGKPTQTLGGEEAKRKISTFMRGGLPEKFRDREMDMAAWTGGGNVIVVCFLDKQAGSKAFVSGQAKPRMDAFITP